MAEGSRRFLAIDYGVRRIGLAKSDPSGTIASALETLQVKSDDEAIGKLKHTIAEVQPSALVIGYPVNANGTMGESCRKVDAFVVRLAKIFDGPIHKVDEYGTSEEAAEVIHAHGKQDRQEKGADRSPGGGHNSAAVSR